MRRLVLTILVLPALLVACDLPDGENDEPEAAPVETPTECAEVSATEGAPAPVTMMDNFFDPLCVAVSSTQGLSLTNAGNLDHNFTVQGTDLSVDLAPGEEEETSELGELVNAGTHRFFCRFHEDQGMVGTIVVE
jgi:plastocyanin